MINDLAANAALSIALAPFEPSLTRTLSGRSCVPVAVFAQVAVIQPLVLKKL